MMNYFVSVQAFYSFTVPVGSVSVSWKIILSSFWNMPTREQRGAIYTSLKNKNKK